MAGAWGCFTILAIRSWDRLRHAEFWAEDVALFGDTFNQGLSSLAIPVGGYFHAIGKIFYFLCIRLFPLRWIPFLETIFWLAVASYVFATFYKKTYRWLLSSDHARLLCAFSLCLMPGLNEMLGNFPNLNWILYVWLVLIGLKDIRDELSVCEVVVATFCFFSMGTALLLAPLFLWRLIQAWRLSAFRKIDVKVLALLCFLGLSQLAIILKSPPIQFTAMSLPWQPTLIKHLFLCFFIQPFFGDHVATQLPQMGSLCVWLERLFAVPLGIFLIRFRGYQVIQGWVLALAGTSFSLILCWIARPALFGYYRITPNGDFWLGHYGFPLATLACVFWFCMGNLIARASQNRWAILLFGLALSHSLSRFTISAYGEERRWEMGVARLEEAAGDSTINSVRVYIYPDPWDMILKVPSR